MKRQPSIALTIPLTLFSVAWAAQQRSASGDEVLQQFLKSDEPHLTRYLAARRLEARNERFKVTGWLDACTELSPERGFEYRVIAEGGSGLIRGRVLKKALDAERQAWADGEVARSRIDLQNYDFVATDQADGELIKLLLKPRRQSRMLVDGAIFLAPIDRDLVRVEGTLAKNPSFWTQRVDVVRRYERVAGVRVPIALESVARIRIAGRSVFQMTYRYSSVNGTELPNQGEPCPIRPASSAVQRVR
jgi:hypothetical protein